MKKYPLVVGLGMLATCGAVFAAWSFTTTGTSFETQEKSVTVTIDDEVTHVGNHGTLTLKKPTAPELYITQNVASGNSATLKTRSGTENAYTYHTYLGTSEAQNAIFELTYAPAAKDEPEIYTFKVNWELSLSSSVTDVTLENPTGSLIVSQNSLKASISLDEILSTVKFPTTLDNYTKAHAWVAAIPENLKINITFKSAELVRTMTKNGYGYSVNNGDIMPMVANPRNSNEVMAQGLALKAGDMIQIHEKKADGFYSYPLTAKEGTGNLVTLEKGSVYNKVTTNVQNYGLYVDIVSETKTIWLS